MPDFCPLMDRHFLAVQRALLQDEKLAARTHLVSVSFDPDYDTPAVLNAHAARVGSNPAIWTWLTGTRETVATFTNAFGISLMRNDPATPEIVHNLRTAVIDRQGQITQVFNGNDWRPEELLAALRVADAR
jgi:protein SCO1/2